MKRNDNQIDRNDVFSKAGADYLHDYDDITSQQSELFPRNSINPKSLQSQRMEYQGNQDLNGFNDDFSSD